MEEWWNQFANCAPSKKYDLMIKNKDNIVTGFEDSERPKIWLELSEASTIDIDAYSSMLDIQSPFDKMISKDIKRTFPEDLDEECQLRLHQMLRVFSVFDGNVGYCQGMSFLGGILVLHLSEPEAFAAFVQIMNNFQIGSFYQPNMAGLNVCIYQFDSLLQDFLPNVHDHLVKNEVDSNLFVSQWFLTFFAYRFPLKTVVRLFDLFLLIGVDALFRVALTLLRKNEYLLCSKSFESLVDYLKNDLLDSYSNVDDIIKDALEIPDLFIQLQMYEQDHHRIKHSPKSPKVETPNTLNSMFAKFKDLYSSQDEFDGEKDSYKNLRSEFLSLSDKYNELRDANNIMAHAFEDTKAEYGIVLACLEELFAVVKHVPEEPLEFGETTPPLDANQNVIQELEKELLICRQIIANQNERQKEVDRVVSKIQRLLKEAFNK
eukprot:NODE_100_length_20331_cov_1.214462.p3 type:complete len:432 gc:universal NODE_100_length_20331_cov_1.214462:12327-11032(-)